jgi:hypothetical protein
MFGCHLLPTLTIPACIVRTAAAIAPEAAPPKPNPSNGESPQANKALAQPVTRFASFFVL